MRCFSRIKKIPSARPVVMPDRLLRQEVLALHAYAALAV